MILGPDFYQRDTIRVARKLLGTFLVTDLPGGKTIGRIVETEAYLSLKDPASHSHNGETKRNRTMFGPAGQIYVYFIYGMYYCVNVVTAKEGIGEAVLIRALEPIKGIPLMQKRRNTENLSNLCSGPGKLTQAMGISKELNGANLSGPQIYIMSPDSFPGFPAPQEGEISTSTRIGISAGADSLLRFYIKGNKFLSRTTS